MRLRQALSDRLSESFKLPGGRKLDVNSEILVTAGANEGIYAFETAFINEGDEVIMMEPFFDHV
jgi:kynurenine aminotransferase